MWDPPRPGIKPAPPAVEGRVLTTGPPGMSHICSFYGPCVDIPQKPPLKFKARENMSDQQQYILAPRDPAAHPGIVASGLSGLFETGICWEGGNNN